MPPSYDPSMADDVAAYLASNSLGRRGFDIFTNQLPTKRINSFLITDTGGAPPEQYYPLDHPSVQVAFYAGAKDHAKGWQKIWDAYHLLNRKQNLTIGSRDAMFARAVATPQSLGLDEENKRWLFTFNVSFKIRGADGE